MRLKYLLAVLLTALVVGSCRPADGDQEPASPVQPAVDPTPAATGTPQPLPERPETSPPDQASDGQTVGSDTANYGYTHLQPDGNRLVSGRGAMPDARVIDVPLAGRPAWIVAAPVPGAAGMGGASAWAAVMDDGQVQAFIVEGDQVTETAIEPSMLHEMPPMLKVTEEKVALLTPPPPAYGPAPPAVLGSDGGQAAVTSEGIVSIFDASGTATSTATSPPLPDARLLVDERGRLLYLSQPTTRYAHGIAGDAIEAAAITLFDLQREGGDESVITIPEPAVIEGIMPLWADLDGDGRREIIVTQSDAQNGAQIVVYDESGQRIATGPAIGLGNRWRHQLAVAPFGPQGEVELVDVLTPHIGGVVEFYQLDGGELKIVASVPGYTSHIIGSRNLDMALAGDVDGDGRIELLLPNQARDQLGAIRRTAGGAEVAWTVPLDGQLSSNLASVALPDGGLIIGAGRDDGQLRLWLP